MIQAVHLLNFEAKIKLSLQHTLYNTTQNFVYFSMHSRVQDHIMLAIFYQYMVHVISTNDTKIPHRMNDIYDYHDEIAMF